MEQVNRTREGYFYFWEVDEGRQVICIFLTISANVFIHLTFVTLAPYISYTVLCVLISIYLIRKDIPLSDDTSFFFFYPEGMSLRL